MERDEGAAPSPGLVLGCAHERSRQPATPERVVDPHRLQLAVPAPDDAGDAGDDPPFVVADEDPELLLGADAGGRDRSGRDALLEQREVGRVRRVLDD